MTDEQYRYLLELLARNSVSLDPEWQEHGIKGMPHLVGEIEREESYLVPQPLRRVTHVVRVVIRSRGKMLKEHARKLAGKPWRDLRKPLLPSEKMFLHETYVEAATRCLQEELQIPEDLVTIYRNTHSVSHELKESTSYPGLPTEYHIHTVEAGIINWGGLSKDCLETLEEDSERIEAHRWKWTDAPSESVEFDARTGRVALILEPPGSISDSKLIILDGEVFEPSLEREVILTGRFLSGSLREQLRANPLHEMVVREALEVLTESEVSFNRYFLLCDQAQHEKDEAQVASTRSIVQTGHIERAAKFYDSVFPDVPLEYRRPVLFITHFTQAVPALQADIPQTQDAFTRRTIREVAPAEWESITGAQALSILAQEGVDKAYGLDVVEPLGEP